MMSLERNTISSSSSFYSTTSALPAVAAITTDRITTNISSHHHHHHHQQQQEEQEQEQPDQQGHQPAEKSKKGNGKGKKRARLSKLLRRLHLSSAPSSSLVQGSSSNKDGAAGSASVSSSTKGIISRPIVTSQTCRTIWAGRGDLVSLGQFNSLTAGTDGEERRGDNSSLSGEGMVRVGLEEARLDDRWEELRRRMIEEFVRERRRRREGEGQGEMEEMDEEVEFDQMWRDLDRLSWLGSDDGSEEGEEISEDQR